MHDPAGSDELHAACGCPCDVKRPLQIEIHAERNEILDQSSLIMRYQAEIAVLRRQLEEAAQGKGVAMIVDPLHPEVSDLTVTSTEHADPCS